MIPIWLVVVIGVVCVILGVICGIALRDDGHLLIDIQDNAPNGGVYCQFKKEPKQYKDRKRLVMIIDKVDLDKFQESQENQAR